MEKVKQNENQRNENRRKALATIKWNDFNFIQV